MLGFEARAERGRVVLRWRTASEDGVVGFNVWRQDSAAERRVNRALIAAARRVEGASYRLVDRTAKSGAAYAYRLQAVNRDGSRSWQGTARVLLTR